MNNANRNSNNSTDLYDINEQKQQQHQFTLPSVLKCQPQQQHPTKQQQLIQNHVNGTYNNISNTQSKSSLLQSGTFLIPKKIIYTDTELLVAIQNWIASLDVWHLTALYILCKESKSLWIALTFLISNSKYSMTTSNDNSNTNILTSFQFTTDQLYTATRVEEEYNIQQYGFVEGQHDYDQYNCSIQLRSIAIILQSL
jgi:chaperone required for assembly of F1-ATPase